MKKSNYLRTSYVFLAAALMLFLTTGTVSAQTEEQKKAQEEGRKTAAEANAIVGLNKQVAESSDLSVKTLAAARGINEAVFRNKNPNETIEMVDYQIKGGHFINADDTLQRQKIREAYDAAYQAALGDQKALVDRQFERDRASTEAERLANLREFMRGQAARADAWQRDGATGAVLDQIGETKKAYIRVQEQAQLAADRFAEAEEAYQAAVQKAEASKAKFEQASKFYIQGNINIDRDEMRLFKQMEAEVAAENAPAASQPAAPEASPAAGNPPEQSAPQ